MTIYVAVGLLIKKKRIIIVIREKKSQEGASTKRAIKIERILVVPSNEML